MTSRDRRDHIVMKIVSTLDRAYLEPRIRELATLLDREEILERWKRWAG